MSLRSGNLWPSSPPITHTAHLMWSVTNFISLHLCSFTARLWGSERNSELRLFFICLRINILIKSEAQLICYGSAGISFFFLCLFASRPQCCPPWQSIAVSMETDGALPHNRRNWERKMEEGMWDNKGKWTDIKDKKVRERVRCKFKRRAVKDAGHLICPRIQVRYQWFSKHNPAVRLKLVKMTFKSIK